MSQSTNIFATVINATIAGLGGLYFLLWNIWVVPGRTMDSVTEDGLQSLKILALWNPDHAIWGSLCLVDYIFLYIYLPGLNRATQELVKMLPYVGDELSS